MNQLPDDIEAAISQVALRDLQDIEVLLVGGGDVIQFGG